MPIQTDLARILIVEIQPHFLSGLTFVGGLTLGFASSLHCAGMCGPIAASLMFGFGKGRSDELRVLMLAQAGRVGSYSASGALLGALGSGLYGVFDHTVAYAVLHWVASAALLWIGLSVAGLVPSSSAAGCVIRPVMILRERLARVEGSTGTILSGIAWGLMPCGMVYAALFYAMMTGTAQGGGLFMLAFGLGTLPALVATSMGVSALRQLARKPAMQVAAGLGIAASAFASVAVPAYAFHVMCLH